MSAWLGRETAGGVSSLAGDQVVAPASPQGEISDTLVCEEELEELREREAELLELLEVSARVDE